MISRDYTKEVGIPSQKKMIPRPLAIVVLILIAIGVSFGVATVLRQTKEHAAGKSARTPDKASSAPAASPAPAQ